MNAELGGGQKAKAQKSIKKFEEKENQKENWEGANRELLGASVWR